MSRTVEWLKPGSDAALPPVELIETDGVPLETPWHQAAISLLIEILTCLFRNRDDFYVGGNMFLYYSEEQARNRDYKGPDFFFVKGVKRFPVRRWWAVWEEGNRYPDVIVELLSPTTAKVDRTVKKELYEKTFHTSEYFCYDPDTQHLEGWRLDKRGRYQPLAADERGWLWSEELGLWLGTWKGEYLGIEAIWLRFYDADGKLAAINVEVERKRAETERQRAKAAEKRAETAEAELARFKAQLKQDEDG